jgi:hypothetical protein
MSLVAFPVRETPNGPSELLAPLLESLSVDEVFQSEADLEEALSKRIDDLAPLVGSERLMLIGRQQVLRASSDGRGGLVLDFLVISETGRRYVVELKYAADKTSVSQCYTYGAQLRGSTLDEIALGYAEHLAEDAEDISEDAALDRIAEFLEIPVEELEETELLAAPGLLVVTPSVTAEEFKTAKALVEDGNSVIVAQLTVRGEKGNLALYCERFFPAMTPESDSRRRRKRRTKRSTPAVDAMSLDILEVLCALPPELPGMISTELRRETGWKPSFTQAMNHLEEAGLLVRTKGEGSGKGAKPKLIAASAQGREFFVAQSTFDAGS